MTSEISQQARFQDFSAFPAPAKINLFLHIIGRRDDGYHLLQTVFRLLDFHDTIFLKPTTDGVIRRVIQVDGVEEQQDLCVRAARLLQQHTGCRLGVDIAIEKRIPMGGGLGGGSSDAASVLLALNRLWKLDLPRNELLALGLRLGADVPIFIFGKNAWAEGIGEKLQAINLNPAHYVVLTPLVHVSTAQVFASKELTRNTIPTTIAAFSGKASPQAAISENWFHNDFETLVAKDYPAVASCLAWLSQFSQARMSGSGASVFAEFDDETKAQQILNQALQDAGLKQAAGIMRGFTARGLDQHPLFDYAE